MGRSYTFSTTATSSSVNEPFGFRFLSGVTHCFELATLYQKVNERIRIGKDPRTLPSGFLHSPGEQCHSLCLSGGGGDRALRSALQLCLSQKGLVLYNCLTEETHTLIFASKIKRRPTGISEK